MIEALSKIEPENKLGYFAAVGAAKYVTTVCYFTYLGTKEFFKKELLLETLLHAEIYHEVVGRKDYWETVNKKLLVQLPPEEKILSYTTNKNVCVEACVSHLVQSIVNSKKTNKICDSLYSTVNFAERALYWHNYYKEKNYKQDLLEAMKKSLPVVNFEDLVRWKYFPG